MTEYNATTKVVVIGGGYSGTLAANHLRMRADVDITLVNPRPRFVERIRLHQLVAGTHEATADYGSLLGDGIKLVVDTATRIDAASRTVELASGPRAGLRLCHLRCRQHRHCAGLGARRGRIRLSHRGTGAGPGPARDDRRPASRRAGDRRRGRADRHRGRNRTRRAGPQGHAGLRRAVGTVAVRTRPSLGRQGDGQAGDHRPRDRRGDWGAAGFGGLRRRRRASERRDDLDGGFRRSRSGRRQWAAHRRRSAGCSPTRR